MLETGRIAQQGSYSSLLESAGAMSDLVRDFVSSEGHAAGAGSEVDDKDTSKDDAKTPALTTDDEGRRGAVGWAICACFSLRCDGN